MTARGPSVAARRRVREASGVPTVFFSRVERIFPWINLDFDVIYPAFPHESRGKSGWITSVRVPSRRAPASREEQALLAPAPLRHPGRGPALRGGFPPLCATGGGRTASGGALLVPARAAPVFGLRARGARKA